MLFGGKELEISVIGRVDKQSMVKVYLDKYIVLRSNKQNIQERIWMHLKNIVTCRKKENEMYNAVTFT